MSREILIALGLFLAPFGVYALYLVLVSAEGRSPRPWSPTVLGALTIVGLVLSVVIFGLVAENAGRQLFGRNPAAEAARSR